MAVVEDEQSMSEFTFLWSIQNFSYFRNCGFKENETAYLNSPKFYVQFLETSFHLRLYSEQNQEYHSGGLSCNLEFNRNGSKTFRYKLSIRMSSGLFKELSERSYTKVYRSDERQLPYGLRTKPPGYPAFLSHHQLRGPDGYLDNDVLTLRFRIRASNSSIPAFIKSYAYTKIKVSKISYVWTPKIIEDSANALEYKFNQESSVKDGTFSGIRYLRLKLSEKSDTIYLAINPVIEKDLYLVYKIHLLDAEENVANSVGGEFLFKHSNNEKTCKFPLLSKLRLLSQKNVYLTNSKLTLRCEFSFSTNESYNEVEKNEYAKVNLDVLKLPPKGTPDGHQLWKENMQLFYAEGNFSDLIVRTSERDIPVHRAILCAQSTVFSSMFKNKMKESISGVVEINDLETETVSKMLKFLYTNTMEEMDYSALHKLYFAADRYRIMALRTVCSSCLTRVLDTTNVFDILVLAETHQDEELKSQAKDFLVENAYEVIHSEAWKKLMETHSHITSELMFQMISKNFLGYLKA